MELKIKTLELQEMVSKVIKCSSNNKLIPITSLMSIKVDGGVLTLTTTDATNYFYVSKPNVVCEDFEVSVMADLFTKLVQKMTSENIVLKVKGELGLVVVKGNGSYTMELPLDENGHTIKFPKKLKDGFRRLYGTVKLTTIKSILNYNKPSIATSIELPSLTCYYCGENVVTSDRFKICSNAVKLCEEPVLIPAQLMELLGVLSGDEIDVSITTEKELVFESNDDTIYAPVTEGIDTFPVSAIMSLVESDFEANCKVNKNEVLSLIDRLNLFVSPYDKRAVRMTFTNDGIMFSSKKSSGVELVKYVENSAPTDYTCMIDIEMLKSQIASQEKDVIELYYGSEVAIKLVSNDIVQIIALAEDD